MAVERSILGILADHLVAFVAGDAGKGVVDVEDFAARGGHCDAFLGVAEDAGRQPHAGFVGAPLGDVENGADHALRRAAHRTQGDAPDLDVHQPPSPRRNRNSPARCCRRL